VCLYKVSGEGFAHFQEVAMLEKPLPDVVLLELRDVRYPRHLPGRRVMEQVEGPPEQGQVTVDRGVSRLTTQFHAIRNYLRRSV